MSALPLQTNSSFCDTTRSGVRVGLPAVRREKGTARRTLDFGGFEAFVDAPGKSVPMCPNDLIDALEKVLVERLCESPATRPYGPLEAVRAAMHKMGIAVQRGPRSSPIPPPYPEAVRRVRSLPEPVRELLRRHFVFLEAEESICWSMNMTSKQVRRLRREAVDYVLIRQSSRRREAGFCLPDSFPKFPGYDQPCPTTSPSKGKK
jgi:hypothetical protein